MKRIRKGPFSVSMNFLGHLYFSNNDPELMYANLFGDSVKGKKYLDYPEEIQKGILLHRKIDDFIDRHNAVIELKRELYNELPKISSVAIDLFFDHLLAQKWNDYHSMPYELSSKNFTRTSQHTGITTRSHSELLCRSCENANGSITTH